MMSRRQTGSLHSQEVELKTRDLNENRLSMMKK